MPWWVLNFTSSLRISFCKINHDEMAYELADFNVDLIPCENVTVRMGANSKK